MCLKKPLILFLVLSIIIVFLMACEPISSLKKPDTSILPSDVVQTKGYLTIEDGRLIEYEIQIPKGWLDVIEVRKEGNTIYYDYSADLKQMLFSISAFTVSEWQALAQEPGRGEELFTQDKVVYVYHIALDNPYTGTQADEFQQMAGRVIEVVKSLTASIISNTAEVEKARNALVTFFDLLYKADYAKAAELYGGSYDILIEQNPDTDPNDHAALLEEACTVNGFQCLPVRQVLQVMQDLPDVYIFTLEFSLPDGSFFELGTCCGESEANGPVQSQFNFAVDRVPQDGNIFLVQELPVYMP